MSKILETLSICAHLSVLKLIFRTLLKILKNCNLFTFKSVIYDILKTFYIFMNKTYLNIAYLCCTSQHLFLKLCIFGQRETMVQQTQPTEAVFAVRLLLWQISCLVSVVSSKCRRAHQPDLREPKVACIPRLIQSYLDAVCHFRSRQMQTDVGHAASGQRRTRGGETRRTIGWYLKRE